METLGDEEAIGEPDGPQLEAHRGKGIATLADQQLRGAATDVAQQQAPVIQLKCLQDAEVDEASLLHAGDHLDLNSRVLECPLQQILAVLGLAHCAGGHGA